MSERRQYEPHIVSKPRLNALHWKLRGVASADYRARCQRCQRTGQAHITGWSRYLFAEIIRCRRFAK